VTAGATDRCCGGNRPAFAEADATVGGHQGKATSLVGDRRHNGREDEELIHPATRSPNHRRNRVHDRHGTTRIRTASVKTSGNRRRNGSLTAASIAALIYDMTKSADKGSTIEAVRLISKSGGKSGNYVPDPNPRTPTTFPTRTRSRAPTATLINEVTVLPARELQTLNAIQAHNARHFEPHDLRFRRANSVGDAECRSRKFMPF
jgi:hypothetical protein